MASYVEKIVRLQEELATASAGAPARVGLAKSTSNLFRDRARRAAPRIDLKHFNRVVRVDAATRTVEAEGMTTYAELAAATLADGAMPCVVPQLRSITVGGAVAGVGIEATSFRHGLVHDTALALEVLTGDGRVVICRPDNEHRDLFFGFPNSYGTLGYALKLTMRTQPVKRFVHVEHVRFSGAAECFAAVRRLAAQDDVDFLDGVVFAADEMYLSIGRFVDDASHVSDYTFEHIYYRSLRERASDFLTAEGYLWRWDTDWFWCSKNVGAQHPLLRRLYGRRRLNSVTYQRIMRWNSRWGLSRALDRLRGVHAESVIQDVDIPLDRAAEFLAFLHAEIGILPIWLCPIRAPNPDAAFTLYPLLPGTIY
ncbi:MAG: FAD-binding oxidoreductase, partial [Steroidobacterales bacterium]